MSTQLIASAGSVQVNKPQMSTNSDTTIVASSTITIGHEESNNGPGFTEVSPVGQIDLGNITADVMCFLTYICTR